MLIRFVACPFAIALLTVAAAAQGRGPLELANAAVPEGAQRIPYGSLPLQFGELRVPSTKGPHPVAIVIHGGCWLSKLGTYPPEAVAFNNMRPLAAALTAAGIATWNIEYRRLGDDGGGWPGTFRDVASAADHIRALAPVHGLDLSRVISIGHSAGAHFALWLAARPKLPASSDLFTRDPLRLAGVVSLDGPGDLKATIALQRPVCGSPVITDLLGGSPEERPDRYRDGSPIEQLPFGIPQVFFTGQMFDTHSAPYEAAVKRAGDVVETIASPKAGHFVFIDPQSEMWPRVMTSVRRLHSMAP
jgi:acetyl esterase/lipase